MKCKTLCSVLTLDSAGAQVPDMAVGGVQEVVVTVTAAPVDGRLFVRVQAED